MAPRLRAPPEHGGAVTSSGKIKAIRWLVLQTVEYPPIVVPHAVIMLHHENPASRDPGESHTPPPPHWGLGWRKGAITRKKISTEPNYFHGISDKYVRFITPDNRPFVRERQGYKTTGLFSFS